MCPTVRALLASAIAASLSIVAQGCSSPSTGPTVSGAGVGPLSIAPLNTYSGYDGTHKYRVPLGVLGGGSDLKITASPPKAVSFETTRLIDPMGDLSTYFFVTTQAAGEVTITASSGGKSVSAKITITAYPASDYSIGEMRYVNGEASDPPCLTCHGEQGGIDHSPTRLAPVTDAQALTAILTGIEPSGDPVPTPKHSWAVTDAEKKGLLSYLRAIPPKGFQNAK